MMHINNMKGYYDLCINESVFKPPHTEQAVKLLYDYGYRTIAVNQVISDTGDETELKKTKKKGESKQNAGSVPKPFNVEVINKVAKKLGYEDFKVLTRLTVSFFNQDFTYKVNKSPHYKKYDIVASHPVSNAALGYTSCQFEADILTYDPMRKYGLRLTRKLYNKLIERGYYIELLYSPCIQDSSNRKNMIHASHLYHVYGKSKNIIFSSGAENYRLIRSPYDIISMGLLFGLSELKCKTSVNEYARKVVLHSIGRKHGKAVMFVENVEEEENEMIEDGAVEVRDVGGNAGVVMENVEEEIGNATVENGGDVGGNEGREVGVEEEPKLKKIKV